jgi:hypothetical protein
VVATPWCCTHYLGLLAVARVLAATDLYGIQLNPRVIDYGL